MSTVAKLAFGVTVEKKGDRYLLVVDVVPGGRDGAWMVPREQLRTELKRILAEIKQLVLEAVEDAVDD